MLRVSWHEFQTAEAMAEAISIQYASLRTIRNVDFSKKPPPPASPVPATEEQLKKRAEQARFDAAAGAMKEALPTTPMPAIAGGDGCADSPF